MADRGRKQGRGSKMSRPTKWKLDFLRTASPTRTEIEDQRMRRMDEYRERQQNVREASQASASVPEHEGSRSDQIGLSFGSHSDNASGVQSVAQTSRAEPYEEQGQEPVTPYCVCNTTCSRKSKKNPGCPCKDDGRKCSARCKCGKKNKWEIVNACKNKAQHGTTKTGSKPPNQPHPDGHVQMEKEIELTKKLVKEFVQKLSKEMLESLVVELSASGSGSVNHLEDLVKIIEGDQPISTSIEDLPWCKCRVCVQMPTVEERKCCGRVRCFTTYHVFKKVCLDRDVLEVNIKAHADHYAEDIEFTSSALRKAACRQFILWKYGKVGYGNRRVIPSCVVKLIRCAFPSPDNQYMGFRYV